MRKTQPRAIAEFANQRENLPFNVGGRPFGRIIEENLVLDLQPAQLLTRADSVLHQWSQGFPSPQLSVRSVGLARFPVDTGGIVRKYLKAALSSQPSASCSLQGAAIRTVAEVGLNLLRAELRADLLRARRHLLHHRQHQLPVAVVQVRRIAAHLAQEADFVVGELRQPFCGRGCCLRQRIATRPNPWPRQFSPACPATGWYGRSQPATGSSATGRCAFRCRPATCCAAAGNCGWSRRYS